MQKETYNQKTSTEFVLYNGIEGESILRIILNLGDDKVSLDVINELMSIIDPDEFIVRTSTALSDYITRIQYTYHGKKSISVAFKKDRLNDTEEKRLYILMIKEMNISPPSVTVIISLLGSTVLDNRQLTDLDRFICEEMTMELQISYKEETIYIPNILGIWLPTIY